MLYFTFMRLIQGQLKTFNHLCFFILLSRNWYGSAQTFNHFSFYMFFFLTLDLLKAPLLSFKVILSFDFSESISSHFSALSQPFNHFSFYMFSSYRAFATLTFFLLGSYALSIFVSLIHFRHFSTSQPRAI